jgi:hypothetical protein
VVFGSDATDGSAANASKKIKTTNVFLDRKLLFRGILIATASALFTVNTLMYLVLPIHLTWFSQGLMIYFSNPY